MRSWQYFIAGSILLTSGTARSDIDFYGKLITGVHHVRRGAIDVTDTDIASAVNRSGADIAPSAESFSYLGTGYLDSVLGLDFEISEQVTGKFELEPRLAESFDEGANGYDTDLELKYYLLAETPIGTFKLGRDTRIYSSVAFYADSFTLPDTWFAGSVYGPERGVGVAYLNGFGPIDVKVGITNPTSRGSESSRNAGDPEPTIEGLIGFHKKYYGIDIAVVSEKRTVNHASGETITWDVARAFGYSAGIWAEYTLGSIPLEAAVVYTGGDALYDNVVKGATLSKDNKDTMNAFALHVAATYGKANIGVYAGMENLVHLKAHGGVDKDGNQSDVKDTASSYGLHLGYRWGGVDWIGEVVNTTRSYDSQTVENDIYVSLGVRAEFSS